MNVTADIAGGTVQDCREMVRRAIMGISSDVYVGPVYVGGIRPDEPSIQEAK